MRKVKKVPKIDKKKFKKMFNDYMHELSEFDYTIKFDKKNQVIYQWFDYYWIEKTRFVFYLIVDDYIAGFAMVRKVEENMFEIAEFYILPEFRGNGNAMWFAQYALNNFDGNFEFSTMLTNGRAVNFWNKVSLQYNHKEKTDKEYKHWQIIK